MKLHELKYEKIVSGDGFCGHEYCNGGCHEVTHKITCETCPNWSKSFAHYEFKEKRELRLLTIEHNLEMVFEEVTRLDKSTYGA